MKTLLHNIRPGESFRYGNSVFIMAAGRYVVNLSCGTIRAAETFHFSIPSNVSCVTSSLS